MGKPRIPSLQLGAQLLLPLAGLHCRRPVEVKKDDYLLHATPEPLPAPAPLPPPVPPAKSAGPPDSPDPEYHAE